MLDAGSATFTLYWRAVPGMNCPAPAAPLVGFWPPAIMSERKFPLSWRITAARSDGSTPHFAADAAIIGLYGSGTEAGTVPEAPPVGAWFAPLGCRPRSERIFASATASPVPIVPVAAFAKIGLPPARPRNGLGGAIGASIVPKPLN